MSLHSCIQRCSNYLDWQNCRHDSNYQSCLPPVFGVNHVLWSQLTKTTSRTMISFKHRTWPTLMALTAQSKVNVTCCVTDNWWWTPASSSLSLVSSNCLTSAAIYIPYKLLLSVAVQLTHFSPELLRVKLCLLIHLTHIGKDPTYITDLLQPVLTLSSHSTVLGRTS